MTPILTIIAPNKNRLDINSNTTKWFVKSLNWQTKRHIFKVLIIDGGSKNYEELVPYLKDNAIDIMQYKTTDEYFHKTLLNNVAIRNVDTDYIMTTDCDIVFGKDFIDILSKHFFITNFIESRVLYWKEYTAQKIYNGELDPYKDLDACKIGRIKQRTTPGAAQCSHKDNFYNIHGYNELYMGWGSEDLDLLKRMEMSGLKVVWMGETRESIMAFHQPHPKANIKNDLEWQEKNKKLLYNIRNVKANLNGWGGYGLK